MDHESSLIATKYGGRSLHSLLSLQCGEPHPRALDIMKRCVDTHSKIRKLENQGKLKNTADEKKVDSAAHRCMIQSVLSVYFTIYERLVNTVFR